MRAYFFLNNIFGIFFSFGKWSKNRVYFCLGLSLRGKGFDLDEDPLDPVNHHFGQMGGSSDSQT